MKTSVLLALLMCMCITIGCLSSSGAQDRSSRGKQDSKAGKQADAWQKLTDREGHFSVDMPGKPTKKVQEGDPPLTAWYCNTGKPHLTFLVTYADNRMPAGYSPKNLIQQEIDSIISTHHVKVLARTDITLRGYPGADARLQDPNGSVTRMRIFIVKTHTYVLYVVADNGKTVSSASIDRFLKSFAFR